MAEPRYGTVVFAVRRERFAILAADQLCHGIGLEPTLRRKIVTHPSLPIAIAVAGYEKLPVDDGQPVPNHVKEALDSLGPCEHLTLDSVRTALEHRLKEFAAQAFEQRFESDGDSAQCNLTIALMEGQFAKLAKLVFTKGDPGFDASMCEFILPPVHILKYLQGIDNDRIDELFGKDLGDPDLLIERVRSTIEELISVDEQREKTERCERDIGGPIDIAIVDREGARLVKY
jgi:hypothetical protein